MMPHETTAGGAIVPGPIDFEPLSRHENVGLLFSGGKDAIALLLLFKKHLHRLTIYHLDTGDTDPEIRSIVDAVEAKVPRFTRIRSDVRAWIAANGPPSDLIPASCCGADLHLHHGRAGKFPIMHPGQCCNANRWQPLQQQQLDADGITLTIDGTRKADNAYGWYVARPGSSPHPHSRVPLGSSVEQWLPIEDWSDADVFGYLRSVGAPIPKMYDYGAHGGDCARCPAFWDSCKGGLRAEHPALAAEWVKDIRAIHGEIARPLAELDAELAWVKRLPLSAHFDNRCSRAVEIEAEPLRIDWKR